MPGCDAGEQWCESANVARRRVELVFTTDIWRVRHRDIPWLARMAVGMPTCRSRGGDRERDI